MGPPHSASKVTSHGAEIEGVTITGSGLLLETQDAGIFLSKQATAAKVINTRVLDNLIGIYVWGAKDAVVKANKIKEKNVATSISGYSVIIKKIDLPRMTEEELADNIQVEAEQFIPYNIDDVNIDFQILGKLTEGQERMDVMLVAAKKDIIDDYTHLLRFNLVET